MAGLLRRMRGASSVADERELLRHARESAARQLEAMKHELAERVQAVRERELQLEEALTNTPRTDALGRPVVGLQGIDGNVADVTQRAELSADHASESRRIEQRLADLREAEKLFLRTQAELASRSEALTAREQLMAGRERSAGNPNRPDSSELAELEARLRRLERTGKAGAGGDTATFAGGLESLRRRGTRRQT